MAEDRGQSTEDREEDEEEQEEPDQEETDQDDSEEDDSDGRSPSPSLSAKEMTEAAIQALRDLTSHEPEAATGLMWDGESWIVTVDVLELERVPDTTDLLATYVVQLDDEGSLRGYKRTRRFQRGWASED